MSDAAIIMVTILICLTLLAINWMGRNDKKGGDDNGNP